MTTHSCVKASGPGSLIFGLAWLGEAVLTGSVRTYLEGHIDIVAFFGPDAY